MTLFSEKNAYFQYMHKWFDAQLDQKILEGGGRIRSKGTVAKQRALAKEK